MLLREIFLLFRACVSLKIVITYFCQETAESCGKPGWTTLYGRLGQALKSDAYADFRLGQLTQVNIVEVSG